MAVTEISVQTILFQIAAEAGELRSEFVTSASSTTVFVARGLLRDPHVTYKDALARIAGKGIRRIAAWDSQSEQLTVASAFDTAVAANDVVEVMGWDATRRAQMVRAVNAAIRQSWGCFGRETVVDAASATLTFTPGTFLYALPTDVDELWEIGIAAANGGIHWFQERDLWRITGAPGAYQLLCREGADLPARHAGEKICLHYLAREPEVSAESDLTRLPPDYFTLAAYLYLVNAGPPAEASPATLQGWNTRVAQLRADADAARERLAVGRPRRPARRVYERRA